MITLPDYVTQFMKSFQEKGFEIYVVGGAVRNLLLGKDIDNWDFTTNATPEEILKMFPKAFYHNTYGTVTVTSAEQLFEVTPFRKESAYTDNRHPSTIEWAKTLEEDLARRDFTINAMALSPDQKIIDPFDGQKHLQEKHIVAVGDPHKRFQEDALRLMRAIRFASQLGFLIENKTLEAIKNNNHLIANISWERIRDELLKIVASEHPAEGILFLRSTGLLGFILPELDACFTVQQKSPKRHHIYDVGTHLVEALRYCPSPDPITRLATLLHDIGKVKTYRKDPKTQIITFYNHEVVGAQQAEEIANRLRLSNEDKEKFVTLIAKHQFTVGEDQTDNAVKRFIREVGLANVEDMLALREGDRLGSGATRTSWRLELFKKRIIEVQHEPFQVKDLKVGGEDVMEVLDIKPSRKVGEVLQALFDEVEEKKIPNKREVLLEKIKRFK